MNYLSATGNRHMARIVIFILLVILLLMPVRLCAEQSIKGNWHTDPGEALAAAKKAKKPVLAAAMDHG